MITILTFLFGLFLAYANGANDNFKGVATLFGSNTTNYNKALLWATLTTALGSLASLMLASGLINSFSGKGLVPDSVVDIKSFPIAIGLSAATTVFLATYIGFPVSTTHSLVGALIGAGFVASSSGLNLTKLFSTFFLPLLISPVVAIIGTISLYPILKTLGRLFGIQRETCLCIGSEVLVPQGNFCESALIANPQVTTGTTTQCIERYNGNFLGISANVLIDSLHYISSGAVSFARGLNDTPKIAAILLARSAFEPKFTIFTITLLIAVGGILSARKVANTMSHKITNMNHTEGLFANLITSALVIFASKFSLPVSTTHVSCGSLFGIGAISKNANWKISLEIIAAWLITLPVAAGLGAVFFMLLKEVIL